MVRPRTGSFTYSQDELEVMKEDIQSFQAAGAQGIVLGVLTIDRRVNVSTTASCVRILLAPAIR